MLARYLSGISVPGEAFLRHIVLHHGMASLYIRRSLEAQSADYIIIAVQIFRATALGHNEGHCVSARGQSFPAALAILHVSAPLAKAPACLWGRPVSLLSQIERTLLVS
jgi:hypothetical protein